MNQHADKIYISKTFEKTESVPGVEKTKRKAEHMTRAPKYVIPYRNQAKTSRRTALCSKRMLLRFAL